MFCFNEIIVILIARLDKQKQGASMNQEHKYIRGIQCDSPSCYACAKQHKNFNRLDKLDNQKESK